MGLLVVIIGLIGTMAIFINPFIGLVTVVALIPQALLPSLSNMFFGVFTAVTPIKIVGGLTFIAAFIKHILKRKSWDFLKRPQMRFFILFLVWVFISGFTQPSSFTRENFTVFTSMAFLGFITVSLVTNFKRFRIVLWTGLLSIFIISLQSVFSYFTHGGGAIRMRGESFGPNYFAMGIIPFLGIAFYNVFSEKKNFLKFFSLAITLTATLALILTSSRTGLIGLLGMFLIGTLKAKRKIQAILFLIVCLVILVNVLPSYFWERLEKREIVGENADPTGSAQRRHYLTQAAWKMFLAHPFFGVGVGNYYWECSAYGPIWAGRAHNMYLEILAELGIIGFFFFAGILFYTFKTLNKIIKSYFPVSGYAWGLQIGLVGFLIAAIFFHAQHEKMLWFVIFMSLALERVAGGTKWGD